MESRAKILGHAAHAQMIVFPLGLLATSVIFDLVYLLSDRDGFATASGYVMGTGILGGLLAAVFGLVDWLGIPPRTRAKRIGALHGLGNVVVLILFTVSWLARMNAEPPWDPSGLALILGFAGLALAGVTGWLGGELIERLGVAVDEGANLNAPSSLSHLPATGVTPRRR